MFKRLFLSLARLVAPFAVIARELTILRELYELELSSRPVPIRRVTESPGKSDTEVTYTGDVPKKKASRLETLTETEEDDEDLTFP